MSAALKSTTILSGLALTGAAAWFSLSRSKADFSAMAKQAGELDVAQDLPKPKLPSEFFSFTARDFKVSNAT